MKRHPAAYGAVAFSLVMLVTSSGCNSTQPSPPPAGLRVTSVTPSVGPSGQATPIRINGTGFESGATVSLDNVVVASTFVNSTQLTTTAPAHGPGPIDVAVVNPGGQASRLERGFTYLAAALRSVSITGNTTLTAIGQTSQLTATAEFSDGATRDVTLEARWFSSFPAVALISPTGLLTATGLGATTVSAQYPMSGQSLFAFSTVMVSPSGTFGISGRVREPGSSGLVGARVVHLTSGQSLTTPSSGLFAMGGLTDGRFSITKESFEPVELTADLEEFVDVPMQRVFRFETGSPPVTNTLAPNDVAYQVSPGTLCLPCRMIRITSGTNDTIRVRITWTDVPSTLNLWLNGQMFPPTATREIIANLPIAGGTDLVVYVGKIDSPFGNYVSFTFEASPGG